MKYTLKLRYWCAISCVLALVSGLPLNKKEKAQLRAKLSSLESLDVEDIPEDTFEEIIEDYETLRPIPAPRKNRLVAKPLALEPDAEMLPVHYKGVKPPGVDHMEMIFVDPDTLGSHHLGKTANQASNIEEVANTSGGKKSIKGKGKGKETHSKQFKLDHIEDSQRLKKGDPRWKERYWYEEEKKRNNRVQKEKQGREVNDEEFGNLSGGNSSEEDSSKSVFKGLESSAEDTRNGDKMRQY